LIQFLSCVQKANVTTNHPLQRRVDSIVQRIAEQVPQLSRLPKHRENLSWTVYIVDSPMANAAAAPGGHMVVFTGALSARNSVLLFSRLACIVRRIRCGSVEHAAGAREEGARAKHHAQLPSTACAGLFNLMRTEDELAGIIAHEMAHVLARHSAEAVTRSALTVAVVGLVEAVTGFASGGTFLMTIAQLVLDLPNSRRNESEADEIGVELAARACFDPRGLADALQVRACCCRCALSSASSSRRTRAATCER
jgi:predicted Zn-dependent protease